MAGNHGALLLSADARSWSSQTNGVRSQLNGVARSGSAYVAVGSSGVIFYSGATTVPPTVFLNPVTTAFNGVVASANGYVVVGNGGTVFYSPDGLGWREQTSNTGNALFGVASSSSTLVAVGSGGTIISMGSGQTQWTPRTSGVTTPLRAVTWDGAFFTAVGDLGVIVRSANGITWSRVPSSTTDNLFGIAAASPQHLVAVGGNGRVLLGNGSTWSIMSSGTGWTLRGAAWDGRRFTAVGLSGTLITSTDGRTWSHQSATGNDLFGISARTDGELLAVGEGGTIIYSSCPCATDDNASTGGNTAITIPVLANDFGNNLSVIAMDSASRQGGSLQNNGDGTITYTPATGFTGRDIFNYTITGDGGGRDVGTVLVTVGDRAGVTTGTSGGGGSPDFVLLAGLALLYRRRRVKSAG
jgi:hypothetical protein